MPSGDGLLVRVRGSSSGLTSRALHKLAALAERFGSGQLELTRRGNVQLRGVQDEHGAPLRDALIGAGLVAESAQAERQLGWLCVDPITEFTAPDAQLHVLQRRMVELLAHTPLPDVLSPKLSLVVDGGALGDGLRADLRIAATGPETLTLELAAPGGERYAADVSPSALRFHVHSLLVALAAHGGSRFLALEPGAHALIRAHSGLEFRRVMSRVGPRDAGAAVLRAPLFVPGSHAAGASVRGYVAAACPFGGAHAATWHALAELVDHFAHGVLRTTPERTVLLGVEEPAQGERLIARLADAGFVVAHDDPRLSVVACAGAPGCASALGPTRPLAARIARVLPRRPAALAVHVSGCEKGCAHGAAAPLTLIAAGEGATRVALSAGLSEAQGAPAEADGDARALAARAGLCAPREPYERDAAAIYRKSFATIRSEARLARFSPVEERVVVRMIHTAGAVDLADDVVFSHDFAECARAAVQSGAPILCDAKMIVSGVTRARLRAHNPLLCFVDEPEVATLARRLATTRSAAAVALWRERLAGALVVIGNAPTALFRLLELMDEIEARPSAVMGLPVGFVGAAESKEALLADGRVPALVVRGRRGGSALSVAAINALAQDEE